MLTTKTRNALYWGAHISRNSPGLAFNISRSFVGNYIFSRRINKHILLATHHKILTVFLGRVFRCFALASNRTISQGQGRQVKYDCDIVHDHHSDFDFSVFGHTWVDIHVRRDPRDLLVSAAFYHQRADESWLHVPREDFGGRSYCEYICSMETIRSTCLCCFLSSESR